MTVEEDVLRRVIDLLRGTETPHMVTGSIAASYYGRPRATHDADVVIDPSPEQLEALLEALATTGFYLNADGARDALRQRRAFNIIEITRAVKVDLIIKRTRADALGVSDLWARIAPEGVA